MAKDNSSLGFQVLCWARSNVRGDFVQVQWLTRTIPNMLKFKN